MHKALVGLMLALLAAVIAAPARAANEGVTSATAPVTVTDYTDPSEALNWGGRSHWKQPWRSYLDTVPATTMLDAIGINFNVSPRHSEETARLLAASGFSRARIEVGWGTLDYDDPSQMNEFDRDNVETKIAALRDAGIRPLIVLNSNQGRPCPLEHVTLDLLEPASVGDDHIQIDPAGIPDIAPGRTGVARKGWAGYNLFTSVTPNGRVTLSQPLITDIPAGEFDAVTLRYEPFRPAFLPDGTPNPRFEPTFRGWLNYVRVVTQEVESMLGSEEFDIEIWNELSFGSAFLEINNYYYPDLEVRTRGTLKEILERTVAWVRGRNSGVSDDVGIGNGFANQSPWHSGTESPVGLTAIDKHPYAGWYPFPEDARVNGTRPLDGLGEPAGWKDGAGQWHESFTPDYDAFFPEYFLSGIQTETLAHDLSPIASAIAGVLHGRYTHPRGGPPPTMWITEVNLGPGSGPTPRAEMTTEDIRHIATKNLLRYISAYVNKGVTAIHFYAAQAGDLSLIAPPFFDALKDDFEAYPGDDLGGESMDAVRRLTASMAGAETLTTTRRLSLSRLTDFEGNVQFEGDGTAAYPPLYNRDVFAFLPFQVDRHRFVIPTYVMTRNVARIYHPDAPQSDPTRFDMPAEKYRMTIGGIHGRHPAVGATDPLTGESVPVQMIAQRRNRIVVEMEVTDSPRLLTIDEGTGPA